MDAKKEEKIILRYMNSIKQFTENNYRVFVRKDYQDGWVLINVEDIHDWASENEWTDLHVSMQRYAVNEDVDEDSTRFTDLIIELDDGETMGVIALSETRRLIEWATQYSPRPGDIRVWFSGNKGFHIILSGVSIGLMPSRDPHRFASFIAGRICSEVGIETADFSMYSKRKTIRLPNSKRSTPYKSSEDSGPVFLYKIELSLHEVMSMDIPSIKMLAMNQRKPLFTDLEVDKLGPNNGIRPFFAGLDEQFRQISMDVESVKVKLKFPEGLKKSIPVCIRDIMAYKFAKSGGGKRNKAMLSLIAFFKDSGRDKVEVVNIVEKWSRSIPWDTHKERERVSQVRSAAELAFNSAGDGYDFSCRKCMSINKGSKSTDSKISCKGMSCPFIEDHSNQGVTTDVSIGIFDLEKISAANNNTSFRTEVYIDKYEQKSYNVPLVIRGRCQYVPHHPKTHAECCEFCSMPYTSDNKNKSPEEAESLIREMKIRSTDGMSLRFIDIKDKAKNDTVRTIFGIPKECPKFRYEELSSQKLMRLLVSSPREVKNAYTGEGTLKEKEVNCHNAFMTIHKDGIKLPEEGDHVSTKVAMVTDGKDQSSCFYISDWKNSLSFLDSFRITRELHLKLHEAHAVKSGETVKEKMELRSKNIMRAVKLVDVHHLVTFIDLIYHSPLYMKLGDKKDRGFMHGAVIGDPGQGKSHGMTKMSEHYGLGIIEDGATTRRTGLLYSIDNNRQYGARVIWGSIVRSDRRLVAIEEFNQLPPETLEKMTNTRSTGVAKVTGQASGTASARTRTIFIGNPESSNGRLDNYNYGIDAIRHSIKKSQDLRRFDIVLIMRSKAGEKFDKEKWNKSISGKKPDDNYSSFMCRNLILWAWTRTEEQVKWEESALHYLGEMAARISEFFRSDVALVEPRDMAMRLGRISQSVAAMLYSSSEDGQVLWVQKEHVEYAANFFHQVMTSVGEMDLDKYSHGWRLSNEITEEQDRWLETVLRVQKWFPGFCRSMMSMSIFAEKSVSNMIDADMESKMDIMSTLLGSGFMRQQPGKMNIVKAPKFTTWLRAQSETLTESSTVKWSSSPSDGDTISEEVDDDVHVFIEDDSKTEF